MSDPTLHDYRAWIGQVTFWPTFSFEVYETPAQGVWLAINYSMPDAQDMTKLRHERVKTEIPHPLILDSESFFVWIRWRLEVIMRHEVHEGLQIMGEKWWDPHAPLSTEPPIYGGAEEIGSGEIAPVAPVDIDARVPKEMPA